TGLNVVISVSFFFSSRRRHTRWPRDWSSDVCSSDLFEFVLAVAGFAEDSQNGFDSRQQLFFRQKIREDRGLGWEAAQPPADKNRSEERRVGKECRSRWYACD